MKSAIYYFFFLILGLIILDSCNDTTENSENVKPDSTKNTTLNIDTSATGLLDDCDYYVDSTQADTMIEKYNKVFDKKGLTKRFWIKACVLKSIHGFLNDSNNSDFDGVRFILGGEKEFLSTKSILMVVPTTPPTSPSPLEKHINQWGVEIPLAQCIPDPLNINISYDDAFKKMNVFGKKFRNESMEGQRNPAGIDPLSIGIWISECKINKLLKLYNKPGNNLDGLMAIAAAYYKDDERRRKGERKYVVQSTFIFVPTVNGSPDWGTITPPEKWIDKGGFNHGQLCPEICD